ncbi:MAG: DUF4336 domain-containing protein [Nitrospira sp.]|nr:DUF4336 domain-containing protein [Nitrospira sp.]
MSINQVGKNIWCIDGDPVKMLTIPFQTRMTVIRLAGDKLWVHSPVQPIPDRIKAINSLGQVTYLIAPNVFHHLSLDQWAAKYPHAKLWGAEGLQYKRKDLKWDGVLKERPEMEWEDEIDQLYFQGSKILKEMVFLHKPSKTLILTDLIQNHDPKNETAIWKMIKKMNGVLAPHGGVPKDLRLTIRDKVKARASLNQILSWDFEKLIISHGLCIEKEAKNYVAGCFSWLKG